MAVVYPLDFPTILPKVFSLTAEQKTSFTESPFSFASQTIRHSGGRWTAAVTFAPLGTEDARVISAFITALRGQHGTFRLGDIAHSAASGSAATTAGTPLVRGASQTGDTLAIDGLPNSTTGYLLAGDYVQVGNILYKVLKNANSNSSGQTTLDIWPSLRNSPADNSVIIVSNPKGIFRLAAPAKWKQGDSGQTEISIAAIEAI